MRTSVWEGLMEDGPTLQQIFPYLLMLCLVSFSWGLMLGVRARIKREREEREKDQG